MPAWDVRRTWSKIVFLLWLTLMTGDKWRWLGRLIFRRSQHDRCLRARVKEAPEFQSLRNSFGVDVAVGHIYAVLLGSTLPETTIACDIMHELAGNHQLQEEVCRWAAHDERAFEAFIRDRCEEYTFFAVGKPRRMPLTGEICRIDHETARTPWALGYVRARARELACIRSAPSAGTCWRSTNWVSAAHRSWSQCRWRGIISCVGVRTSDWLGVLDSCRVLICSVAVVRCPSLPPLTTHGLSSSGVKR